MNLQLKREKSQQGIILRVPGGLREAFVTFLENSLEGEDMPDQLEEQMNDEFSLAWYIIECLQNIKGTEPTPEEVLSRNRALLRGDSADIEGP